MTGPDSPLLRTTRGVVAAAARLYQGHPAAARCAALGARLDGPLRLVLAGKVKAGKSTLLNALVGDRVAPADAGECTKVVTWYQAAPLPRIVLQPRAGPARELPVRRRRGALVIDPPMADADVEHIVVGSSAPDLRSWTVIDTPGIASLSAGTSARAARLLDPEQAGAHDGADAVVYLLRHLQATDVEFLETFREAPVNAVAVLSRADEIGGGRLDAMEAAARVAARYRADPAVRGLCLDVVAVAGLLAETGRTVTPEEFALVRALAALPPGAAEDALRSADRFLAVPAAGLAADQRSRLLARFGVFGLRLAILIVRGGVAGPAGLGIEMVRRSGLEELRSSLTTRLQDRRDVLVARSVLLGLRGLLRAEPAPGATALAADVGRILLDAHQLVELRTLAAMRAGPPSLPPDLLAEGLRLLGDAGPSVTARLALPPGTGERECRARAMGALRRWREWADHAATDPAAAAAGRTVVRTCEGIVTSGVHQWCGASYQLRS